MLAMLFLVANMRAMQHDGKPQPFAERCMTAATASLCLTSALAIVIPLAVNGTMQTDPRTKEVRFSVPDPTFAYLLVPIRIVTTLCFYGGALGVVISIIEFESPDGPQTTRPISPT